MQKSDMDKYLHSKTLLRIIFPEIQVFDLIKQKGFIDRDLIKKGKMSFTSTATSITQHTGKTLNTALNTVTNRGSSGSQNNLVSPINSVALNQGKKTDKRDIVEIDLAFNQVEQELSKYLLEQQEYISKLCIAFKRPYFLSGNKSYKNLIFVFGNKGSGRHLGITAITKLFRDNSILSRGNTYNLDLAKYDTEKSVNELFLPNLYKAFYGPESVVVIDNFEHCHNDVKDKIISLGIDGVVKVDKLFIEKFGQMQDVTSSLILGTTDEISANGKYIVFISDKDEDYIAKAFPKAFIDNITDIIYTNKLSNIAYSTIANIILDETKDKIRNNLGIEVNFEQLTPYILSKCDFNKGVYDILDFIELQIYRPLVELLLTKQITRGAAINISVHHNSLVCNTGRNTLELDLVIKHSSIGLEELKNQLNDTIGLNTVKSFIYKLEDNLKVQVARNKQADSISPKLSLHMIFSGNPGTGKTTIARIVAGFLKEFAYLSSGHLIEVSRSDLVGQYIGETAQKTMNKIKSALGGVLFIDEAYSLAKDKNDIFGIEAVDTLVKAMEDYRENLVVILAGYTNEMEEFIKTNPGLKSRFNYKVVFPDYNPEELLKITKIMAKSNGYIIDKSFDERLIELFDKKQIPGKNDSGNGRLARNIVELAITNHSERLSKYDLTNTSKEQLNTLMIEDFGLEDRDNFDFEAELKKIIGLESIKNFVRGFEKQIIAGQMRKNAGMKTDTSQSLNMIFTGNPGTGKTTVARLLAKLLKEMGVLKQGQLIEADRSSLVSEYLGQSATKTKEIFMSALGGVLFIDEAYALMSSKDHNDPLSQEAINTLVKLIEDHRGNIVVILAGYKKEMVDFMTSNSGLQSRFSINVDFPDYSATELLMILQIMAKDKGFTIKCASEKTILNAITSMQRSGNNNTGNGRLARNILEEAIRRQSYRIASNDLSMEALTTLVESDFKEEKSNKTNTFDIESKLSQIIGLEEVKNFIRSLNAQLRISMERKKLGIGEDSVQSLHMIFKGNPGTGKTMMARIIGELFYEMGILKSKNFIETDRGGLVAGYVGQTSIKTRAVISEALNGILFIDEAYSLANDSGSQSEFGKEAIDTLVKDMDDNRDRLVVILAGYSDDMDRFSQTNPGLKSRFANVIDFPDYNVNDLMKIANLIFENKNYYLTEGAKNKLRINLENAKEDNQFGNGRYVRNVYEKSIRNQAMRLNLDEAFTKEELSTIEAIDIDRGGR